MKKILKKALLNNIKLIDSDLVVGSFGNVSLRYNQFCIIKPSGVDLTNTSYADMSVINIFSNKLISGFKPSTDTPTHLELLRNFQEIGAVTHTHSQFATAWAQAAKPIPCLGTTHADYWNGEIPVTRSLTKHEINQEYELETGKRIVETLEEKNLTPIECPGILVAHHGPFTWGKTVEEAVYYAEMLEYIAKLAWMTLQIQPSANPISIPLHQRHFTRKHGPKAYYGQEIS